MKPYLEVKVVKVRSESNRKLKKLEGEAIEIQRKIDRIKGERGYKEGKWSGVNWINGENIQKIKFPCFCSFVKDGEKRYGEINTNYNEHKEELEYELSDITQQVDGKMMGSSFSVRYSDFSLEDLIKCHDVHIKRGKIIIFDEEKNK